MLLLWIKCCWRRNVKEKNMNAENLVWRQRNATWATGAGYVSQMKPVEHGLDFCVIKSGKIFYFIFQSDRFVCFFFPLAVFWKRNLICHICWSGVNLLKPQRLIFCEFCHILSLDNHKLQWVSLCRIKTHRLHFCFFHKKTTRMKLFAFHFVKTAHAPSDWVDGICEQQLFESCPRVSARFLFGLRLGHPAT